MKLITNNHFYRVAALCCLFLSFGILSSGALAQDETPQERAQVVTAKAVEQFNRGQFDDALKSLQQSLAIEESIHETHYWLGRVYATKAGNSPEARQRALVHFSRAVALQPFGDEGDLARGWLVRFTGRPDKILVVAVNHPELESFNEEASSAVAGAVANAALTAKYSVLVSKSRYLDLNTMSVDELAEMCRDSQGSFTAGWVLCIGVEKVKEAKSSAKAFIFDPIAKQLYDPLSFSTSFNPVNFGYKPEGSQVTGNPTLDSLSVKIWRRCSSIVGSNADPKLLDEVQIASVVPGIYLRAATSYEEALALPLMMVTPVASMDEDGADAARKISSDLLQGVLETKRVAAISPGSTRQILKALQIDLAKATAEDFTRAGQTLGCRYAFIPTLTRFDLTSKNIFIGTKVTATVHLKIVILECASGKEISSKTYEKSASSTKLGGDGLKKLLQLRERILDEVVLNASADIKQLAPA